MQYSYMNIYVSAHSVPCYPNNQYFSDFCNHGKYHDWYQNLQRNNHQLSSSLRTFHFQSSRLFFPASCRSEYYLPVEHNVIKLQKNEINHLFCVFYFVIDMYDLYYCSSVALIDNFFWQFCPTLFLFS